MNSSNKPSKLPLQRNLSSEVSQFIAANQEEFAELLTFIDFAEKFTIGFVEVNFSPDTELLIEALKSTSECQEIQFVVLDFPDKNLRFIRDEILEILPTIQLYPNKKLVLIVRGLEKSIGVFGDYPPVLQDLNFVRDAYRKTVPHPMLFILPDYAITRLAKFAPDFWAWKSGIFRFKTTQVTKDYAMAQTLESERTIDRLPTPEQQERIDLLERLLMENKPTGHQVTGQNLRSYTNILHQLGVAYLSQRNPVRAKEYLEEAIKQVDKDSDFYAEIINTLGKAYYQQRQFDTAINCYQESLNISRTLENRRGEIASLYKLGNAYLELRQFQQAREFYQQCIEIEQQLGDRFSQARIYHQLGRVAQQLRDYQQARAYYQQALDIKIEFGDRYEQAGTYHQLGRVAQQLRDYQQARADYQQALDITIEFGDRYSQAGTYHQLGRVAEELRDYQQARAYYQQALDITIEFGDRFSQARIYHQLGRVAQQLRDYQQARAYYQQALDIKIEFGDRFSQALTYYCLASLAQEQEDYPEARAYFQKALEIYAEYQDEYRGAIAREALERLPDNSEN